MSFWGNDHCTISYSGDGVASLTITNAGKANVLSSAVILSLRSAFSRLAAEQGLRVIVLRSQGQRTFIAGADIKEMAKLTAETAGPFICALRDLCDDVRRFPIPVVARIQGWCLGGGLELAMSCDIRVAATEAKFAMPEVKVGIPSVIHAALMPRLLGYARARWLILTGSTIGARTAHSWGLVDVVSADDKLDETVSQAIAPILGCGPAVIAAQKALLREWEDLPLTAAIEDSVAAFQRSFETGEPQRFMEHQLAAMSQRNRAR